MASAKCGTTYTPLLDFLSTLRLLTPPRPPYRPPPPHHDPQIALTAPRPSFASPADQAKTAILALADRTGSSLIAIKKYLNVAPDKNRFLNAGLAAGVKNGTFIKVKGSFKVSPAAKKPAKKKAAPKKVRCGVVVCGVWR